MLATGGYFLIKCCQAGAKYYENPDNLYFKIYGDNVQGIPTKESIEYVLEKTGFDIISFWGMSNPLRLSKKIKDTAKHKKMIVLVENALNRMYSAFRDLDSQDRFIIMARKTT